VRRFWPRRRRQCGVLAELRGPGCMLRGGLLRRRLERRLRPEAHCFHAHRPLLRQPRHPHLWGLRAHQAIHSHDTTSLWQQLPLVPQLAPPERRPHSRCGGVPRHHLPQHRPRERHSQLLAPHSEYWLLPSAWLLLPD